MKRIVLLFAVGLGLAALVSSQETTATTEPPPPPTKNEALIKAAKEAKAKRKTHSTRVITNADVKKAKGKLIERKAADTTAESAAPTLGLQQKHDATLKEKDAAVERVETARKKVDELQKALDAIEQHYYEENDPNYRDDVIRKRFAQTRKQLEAAQQELADARDGLDRLDNPPDK